MNRSPFRLIVLLALCFAEMLHAQVSYTGGVYSQNFDTLPGTTNNTTGVTWVDNTTLAGWYSNRPTFGVTDATMGGSATSFNSTSNANNIGLFSFGQASSTDRAIGSRSTTNLSGYNPIIYGVKLINDTDRTLTKFTVIYTGEQWFKTGGASAHTLNLDYQIGASSLTSGSWSAVPSGTFTTPVFTSGLAALNGNTSQNRTLKVAVVSGVSWAPGQSLWIRFRDDDEASAEQGLSADDFFFLADTELGLFFNGSTSFVTMGAAASTLGANSFTIECRFLKTGSGITTSTGLNGVTAVPLVSRGRDEGEGNATDCNYFLGIDANNKLVADFEQLNATNNGTAYAAGQNFPVTGSTTLQEGVWYHVAATYNTTTATWGLYVNGIAETLSTPLPTFTGVIPRSDSIQHFGIGTALNSSGAAAGFFQGAIDEVRVWNYARDAADILANKDTKITTGVTGLLARYGLDEGAASNTSGINATGLAPTGTLSGSTLPQWVNTKAFTDNQANTPPVVSLTSPADNSTYDGQSPPTLVASATDAEGGIAKVEFYNGTNKLGEVSTFPYSYSFPSSLSIGSYSFTARAFDILGASASSAAVNVSITNVNNVLPTASITNPLNGRTFNAGDIITISATAGDADGSIAKLQIFQGELMLAESSTTSVSDSWSTPTAGGVYTLRAIATDNDGATTTSTPVTITLTSTQPQYSYSQNFDSMGSGSTMPSDWSFFGTLGGDSSTWTDATGIPLNSVSGGLANSTLIADTSFAGSSDTQGYNFAQPDLTTDRALGTSPASAKGVALQLSLTNTTGVPLHSLRVGYDIRRFTAGAAGNELPGYRLFYSINGGTTWTNVTALNPTLNGPTGVIVPNTIGITTVPPTNFCLSNIWPTNGILLLRWVDDNAGQSSPNQIIGLDNVTVASGELRRGPYLQKAAANQITIRWRTISNAIGRVRFGATIGNLTQTADELVASAEHSVTLTGLAANTTYFYSIGTASETIGGDETFTFTTPPLAGAIKSTRIWALGDAGTTGNNPSETRQKAVRDAFYNWTDRTPDLVLQLGDNAYNSGYDSEFQAGVFDIYPTMLRKTTFWSCLGNHETAQSTSYKDAYPYFNIYTFPTAGECGGLASGTEHYYSFDYGNIHFISLDSMTASRASNGAMATWLQSDLASTAATWIICFFHHPPYTKGSHNSDSENELIQIRTNILPILEAGGVDLVLSGHSHCYERSMLIDGFYATPTSANSGIFKSSGNGRESGSGATGAYSKDFAANSGAVYTVAGSAGKADTSWTGGSTATVNPNPHPVMFSSLLTLGSMVLDINGNRLDAKFISASGSVDDYFTLIKQGNTDSDGDGIPDEYEVAHGLNRRYGADAILDGDKDGIINRNEYILGLNSLVPDHYNFTTNRDNQSGAVTVNFPTIVSRNYVVWYSDDLIAWNPASSTIAGTGSNQLWVDDGVAIPAPAKNRRFYQIRVTTTP